MLPETARLSDYGLGHDKRAEDPRPVASRLGPRFYDWQVAQRVDVFWRECHLHARNLLGETGYRDFIAEIEAEKQGIKRDTLIPQTHRPAKPQTLQKSLFD
jgi:hypothetical protein